MKLFGASAVMRYSDALSDTGPAGSLGQPGWLLIAPSSSMVAGGGPGSAGSGPGSAGGSGGVGVGLGGVLTVSSAAASVGTLSGSLVGTLSGRLDGLVLLAADGVGGCTAWAKTLQRFGGQKLSQARPTRSSTRTNHPWRESCLTARLSLRAK